VPTQHDGKKSSWNMFFHSMKFGLIETDHDWNFAAERDSGIGRVLSVKIPTRTDNFSVIDPFPHSKFDLSRRSFGELTVGRGFK
jgi:hypothetical protein